MAIFLILTGAGGELDRHKVPEEADTTDLADQLVDACGKWIIGVGDTITIVEE